MKIQILLFFTFIGAVWTATVPSYKDIHKTVVDIGSIAQGSVNHHTLFVAIKRVDDLVDKNGHLMAERIKIVELAFEVADGQKLMCNGVHVPIGISNVHVRTRIFTTAQKQLSPGAHFDIGLAKIKFRVSMDQIKVKGEKVNRIKISESILEINEKTVDHQHAHQEFLLYPDGSFVPHHMTRSSHDVEKTHVYENKVVTPMQKIRNWYNRLPLYLKTLAGIYVFAGTLLSLIAILIVKRRFAEKSGYDPVDNEAFESKECKKPFYMLGNDSAITTVNLLNKE